MAEHDLSLFVGQQLRLLCDYLSLWPSTKVNIWVMTSPNALNSFSLSVSRLVFNLGQPPRKLVLLHLDGSMVVMPENGAKLFDGDKEVGFIGTVARHYELGPIALAVIKRNTPASAVLIADGVSASIYEEIGLRAI